jgi:CRP-like cAMP-binding protein
MAGFVDSAVKDIDARMEELRGEMTRLEAARAALVGSSRRATRTRGRTATRRRASARPAGARRGGGRRGGNTRAAQALALVRERPGITIPEIAQAMGIEPNYLYRVMPRLVNEGQIRRDGQGWHPAQG